MKKLLLFICFFSVSFFYGLSDDLSVSIKSTCPEPIFSVSNVDPTTILVSWIELGTINEWEILILPCGSAVPDFESSGNIIAFAESIQITALNIDTCYEVYMRSRCSDGNNSAWSGPAAINTSLGMDCGDVFYDIGGVLSNYLNNSNYTYTICPSNPGEFVTVTFTSFDIESNNDALYIYDGSSTASPQISSGNIAGNVPGGLSGGFWGNTNIGTFTSSSPDGCLTFKFVSNDSVTSSGWIANISCGDNIQLISFLDSNNNGIQDNGEINFTNGSFVYQINDSGLENYVSSVDGFYNLFDANSFNSYDFSFLINSEYSSYLSNSTVHNNISIIPGSGVQTLLFPINVTSTFNDVSAVVVPINQPRPGFNYSNLIVYKNIGTQIASGTINFIKDPEVSISSISQSGTTSNSSGFSYDFNNLLPNESRNINVTMTVPTIPTVNLNDVLTNSVNITMTNLDINLTNNSNSNSQIVVGSYDPNDKMESHGGRIQFNQFAIDDYLFYTVRFQNEGTAEAITVRIEDFLDSQLDESSLRMISASHPYVMKRINNQIIWTFENINLLPTITSEELSKGYIIFKLKLKPGFALGDIIPNTANIYFDFNPAIVTNTFNTEFVASLSNTEFDSVNTLIYPNPSNEMIHIELNKESKKIKKILIYDILGKEVKKVERIHEKEVEINISELLSGVYMIEITNETDLKQVKKLIIN